jgi:cysteine synthase
MKHQFKIRDNYYKQNFKFTPLYNASKFSNNRRIYVKLEGDNLLGSIKSRSAFYMLNTISLQNLSNSNRLNVVESSSGNLALALHYFSEMFNIKFLCITDRTTSPLKQQQLLDCGVNLKYVEIGNNPDLRTARIKLAKSLHDSGSYIWLNQYQNKANALAHYETTAPEIFKQSKHEIDWIIVSVGSGGTISGIAKYLKEKNPTIKVIGVEPLGSTSFGGINGSYATAGAGMRGPSELLKSNLEYIDYFCQVPDSVAAFQCLNFYAKEGLKVGLTTGHCLAVAYKIAKTENSKIIVVSPDKGDYYNDIIGSLVNETDNIDEYSLKIKKVLKV